MLSFSELGVVMKSLGQRPSGLWESRDDKKNILWEIVVLLLNHIVGKHR